MSATGTPKASQAAITAVQEALGRHRVGAFCGTETACSCDRKWRTNEEWRAHVAVAAADAAAPHNAAQALRDAAGDKTLRLGGHSGVSVRGLRRLADQIEAGQ